jgi:hypothetical protein
MLCNVSGYSGLEVDGAAGILTISALVKYQNAHYLVPDGICGPLTRADFKKEYEGYLKTKE